MKRFLLQILLIFVVSGNYVLGQNTFVVTSTNDVVLNPPVGTLRWAIEQANLAPGLDFIHFNIPGNAPATIQLSAPTLPVITDRVVIDGSTQPITNYNSNEPKITIQGGQSIEYIFYLGIGSDYSLINGFVLKNTVVMHIYAYFSDNHTITNNVFENTIKGVSLYHSSSNTIKSNYFGTNTTLYTSGSLILTYGVSIFGPSPIGWPICCNAIGGYNCEDRNYFYNTKHPIESDSVQSTLFQGNVMYNNTNNSIVLYNMLSQPTIPLVNAEICSGNIQFYGTASPGELIEVVKTNAQGLDATKVLARVNADAGGNWCVTSNANLSVNDYVKANAYLPNTYTAQYSSAVQVSSQCTTQNNCYNYMALICDTPVVPVSLPCEDCLASFSPTPGKKYLVSAWVKENTSVFGLQNYDLPQIKIYYHNGTLLTLIGTYTASGNIIDGWQKIENEFFIPSNATQVQIKLECTTTQQYSNDCYFDDIRVFPFDASLKSYVYDPINMRFVAELDERNYATFYEYDEEGKLTRIKKETEKGIMTIQEVRKNNPK
ncbi:MAG: NosD domain-containing protein [Bacteroidia bacterium]